MLSSLAGLLRLVSLAICLVAIASFGLFAINQTGSASSRQQQLVNGGGAAPSPAEPPTVPAKTSSSRESSLHRAIDDASNALTSPFAGITAGSSSEWVVRGTKLLLALIVYGFGLGFLARTLRVRV